jgi:hypothetical protein
MKGERGERWRDLCSQAAEEQDPDRLMELVREINALLEEKEQRLKREKSCDKGRAAEG